MSQLIGTQPEIEVAVEAKITENGKTIKVPFTVVFDRIDRATAKKIMKDFQEKITISQKLIKELGDIGESEEFETRHSEIKAEMESLNMHEENLVRSHFKSFKDLKGVDKKVIEYSDQIFEEMMNWPSYYEAILQGFKKATGYDREKAKEKN